MAEVTQAQLRGVYNEIRKGAEATAEAYEVLVKLGKSLGLGSVEMHGYEANRRLEEFMHRVGDTMSALMTRSVENVEKVAGEAVAKAGFKVHEGGQDAG